MRSLITISFSTLFIFFINSAIGQYASVFGNATTEWYFVTLYCDATFSSNYLQQSDTIIVGNTYKIIDDLGLMRESDDRDKLWFRDAETEEEHLIMDLNLSVGDLFEINSFEYEVESIFEEDGRKTIQFDFIPPHCGIYEKLRFVEGLGPNFGVKFLLSRDEFDMEMIRCHTKDMETDIYFEDELGPDCIVEDGVFTKDISFDARMYPVPFDETLKLGFNDANKRLIQIFDIAGNMVVNLTSEELISTLDTQSLQSGQYILQVIEDSKLQSTLITKR